MKLLKGTAPEGCHLLLVDLLWHSGPRSIGPFSLPEAADAVANVISSHAHDGVKAHVVGSSLGGFTALELATRHPDLLLSCFVTRAMPWRGVFRWFGKRPRLIWLLENVLYKIPILTTLEEKIQRITVDERLAEEYRRNRSWDLTKEVYGTITTQFSWSTVQRVAESGVSTCAVAGGKMDQVGGVREMGRILREGGIEHDFVNEAVVVEGAVHQWNLQFPGLFALGVKAWIDGQPLPSEYRRLRRIVLPCESSFDVLHIKAPLRTTTLQLCPYI